LIEVLPPMTKAQASPAHVFPLDLLEVSSPMTEAFGILTAFARFTVPGNSLNS